MKKSFYIFILLLVMCIPTINVKANTAECFAKAHDSETVGIGEIFRYDIGTSGMASNQYAYGLHYVIEYDADVLEPVSVKKDGIGSYIGWNNIKTEHYTLDGLRFDYLVVDLRTTDLSKAITSISSDEFVNVGYVDFKVISTEETKTKITLMGDEDYYGNESADRDAMSPFYYTYMDDEPYDPTSEDNRTPCYENVVTYLNVISKSSDASLSSLTINKGELSPKFDKDTTSYRVEVENNINVITLNAECSGKKCEVKGTGTKELEEGSNSFQITVKAESGNKTTYTVEVVRKGKDNDITLKSLTIKDIDLIPEFKPDVKEYKVNVENNIEEIEIESECNGNNCTISGIGKKYLKVGENEHILTVVAEDGTKQEYKITIVREEAKKNYTLLYVILGVLILVIVVVIVIIIKKRKKNAVKKEEVKEDLEEKEKETDKSQKKKNK